VHAETEYSRKYFSKININANDENYVGTAFAPAAVAA
jgi:hypothetical protein